MNLEFMAAVTGSTDDIKELPVGQYLLKMQNSRSKNIDVYWAVGSLKQGGNSRLLIIDGHFDFDNTDTLLEYARLPDLK